MLRSGNFFKLYFSQIMITNHFKTAFRYLKNHRQFTLINVLGLTFGFYCFFLLNLYVLRESSFDRDQDQVFRLLDKAADANGNIRESAQTAPAVGRNAEKLFDEIEYQTQVIPIGRRNVGNDPETVTHEPICILGVNFSDVFNFSFAEGSLTNTSNGIVLTKTLKEKYFGSEPALEKTLKMGGSDLPVVAVFNDFPENTHFSNGIFLTETAAKQFFKEWDQRVSSDYVNNNFITYFKLKPATNLKLLAEKITRLAADNYPADETFNSTFALQPVEDIHLYEHEVEGEMNQSKGNGLYVKFFFGIGFILLLVACFNYAGLLNISFMDRAREIGMRQMMGAGKLQLLWQFLSESMLLTGSSMLLAFFLLLVTKSSVQNLFNSRLKLSEVPVMDGLMVIFAGVLISFLAVAYPFRLIMKTSNNHRPVRSKLPFRRFMLVFQFVAVISFLMGSIVFSRQLTFLKNRQAGFVKEGLATIDINSYILRSRFEAIKTELKRIPEVAEVSVSSRLPGEWKNIPLAKALKTGQSSAEATDALFIGADKDFLKTFTIRLKQGKNFSGSSSDSTSILINKTAAEALGPRNPVGQHIEIPAVNFGGSLNTLERPFNARVIGVVEDFQMEDFRTPVKPLIIAYWNNPIHSIDYYTLKIASTNWEKTRADLEGVNDAFDPNSPMEFNILDDQFARFLDSDLSRFKLLNFFSGIVVLLAFMGLFAMSVFVARSRIREIGIRKVLGSTVPSLVTLLSRDFVKLLGIGFVIAAPLSWYLLDQWLSDFAYRIDIKWWMAAISGFCCLLLTIFTVSFESIKAALVNPVDSLKAE